MAYTVGSSRSPLATERLCFQVQGQGLGTTADKLHELALDEGYSMQSSWNAFKAVLLGGIYLEGGVLASAEWKSSFV